MRNVLGFFWSKKDVEPLPACTSFAMWADRVGGMVCGTPAPALVLLPDSTFVLLRTPAPWQLCRLFRLLAWDPRASGRLGRVARAVADGPPSSAAACAVCWLLEAALAASPPGLAVALRDPLGPLAWTTALAAAEGTDGTVRTAAEAAVHRAAEWGGGGAPPETLLLLRQAEALLDLPAPERARRVRAWPRIGKEGDDDDDDDQITA